MNTFAGLVVHSFSVRNAPTSAPAQSVPSIEPTETFNAAFVDRRLEIHQAWQDLAPAVEWIRFCYACNEEHPFVATKAYANGLGGKCTGCGDERVAPFTRTTTEAA